MISEGINKETMDIYWEIISVSSAASSAFVAAFVFYLWRKDEKLLCQNIKGSSALQDVGGISEYSLQVKPSPAGVFWGLCAY